MKIKRNNVGRKTITGNQDKGKAEPTPLKKKKVSLRNVQDIKRVLTMTINELRREEISPLIGGKVIFGLNIMIGIFGQIDLEARIRQLEELNSYGGR